MTAVLMQTNRAMQKECKLRGRKDHSTGDDQPRLQGGQSSIGQGGNTEKAGAATRRSVRRGGGRRYEVGARGATGGEEAGNKGRRSETQTGLRVGTS